MSAQIGKRDHYWESRENPNYVVGKNKNQLTIRGVDVGLQLIPLQKNKENDHHATKGGSKDNNNQVSKNNKENINADDTSQNIKSPTMTTHENEPDDIPMEDDFESLENKKENQNGENQPKAGAKVLNEKVVISISDSDSDMEADILIFQNNKLQQQQQQLAQKEAEKSSEYLRKRKNENFNEQTAVKKSKTQNNNHQEPQMEYSHSNSIQQNIPNHAPPLKAISNSGPDSLSTAPHTHPPHPHPPSNHLNQAASNLPNRGPHPQAPAPFFQSRPLPNGKQEPPPHYSASNGHPMGHINHPHSIPNPSQVYIPGSVPNPLAQQRAAPNPFGSNLHPPLPSRSVPNPLSLPPKRPEPPPFNTSNPFSKPNSAHNQKPGHRLPNHPFPNENALQQQPMPSRPPTAMPVDKRRGSNNENQLSVDKNMENMRDSVSPGEGAKKKINDYFKPVPKLKMDVQLEPEDEDDPFDDDQMTENEDSEDEGEPNPQFDPKKAEANSIINRTQMKVIHSLNEFTKYFKAITNTDNLPTQRLLQDFLHYSPIRNEPAAQWLPNQYLNTYKYLLKLFPSQPIVYCFPSISSLLLFLPFFPFSSISFPALLSLLYFFKPSFKYYLQLLPLPSILNILNGQLPLNFPTRREVEASPWNLSL